jgi:hypothetical protein
MQRIKVLFLAANPAGTAVLRLDEEAREIEAKIRASEHRDSLELITKWAVRPDDLLQFLNQYKPQVVHFSGHGSPGDEIILLDALGSPKAISKEALVNLFRTLTGDIRVVLLNACFSRPQGEAITEQIECAVGMNKTVGDKAAITFAAAFYRAVGFGCSVAEAFAQGRTALLLEGIPEDKTPELIARKGVDPARVILITPAGSSAAGQAPGTVHDPGKSLEVFYSYSHKDEKLREQLESHLALLKRQAVIAGWHDRKIGAGTEWKGQIDQHMNSASVILLLVSNDFIASDYCYDIEMRRALERHEAKEARVIPVILRPVDWQSAPFAKLQALPKDGKPVTKWSNRDEAFVNIAQGIREAVRELRQNAR